jgi:hypothetical protein
MQSKCFSLAVASFATTAAVLLACSSGVQAHEYRYYHHHYYRHEAYNDRPLTVTKHRHRYYAPTVEARDPWRGPVPIITGPNYVAATIVSLPFRAANSIFPAYGDPATNPLILIGAPVHVAAQVAEFPFYAVGTVFGAPPPVIY